MSPPDARFAKSVEEAKDAWMAASLWGPEPGGRRNSVSMGRKHVEPSMRPLEEHMEPTPTATQDEARVRLHALMDAWPRQSPRLAIQGGTSLGKTTYAIKRCVDLVASDAEPDRKWLFVAPSLERVDYIVRKLRLHLRDRGLQPDLAQELYGRRELLTERGDDWEGTRFGCFDAERAAEYGHRGRNVTREVCGSCPWNAECQRKGYLGHSRRALRASIIVTTAQRLASLKRTTWSAIAGAICDEDVLPMLVESFDVKRKDLRRARRWLRNARQRRRTSGQRLPPWERAILPALGLVNGALAAIRSAEEGSSVPLLNALPDSCDVFLVDEGAARLRALLPTRGARRKPGHRGRRTAIQDPRLPAPWEESGPGRAPRQVWGRFVRALLDDVEAGDADRSATVWLVRGAPGRKAASVHVHRFDDQVLDRLRSVPLLMLDATLHPAAHLVLNLDRHELKFRDQRRVLQVLAPLCRPEDVHDGSSGRLKPLGRRLASRLARVLRGREAYVLCSKRIVGALTTAAKLYWGLERAVYITPKRERGWNAEDKIGLFVVVGRYARNSDSCVREAHALRSIVLRREGSTASLDAMERPAAPIAFRGRGRPLLYRGLPVQRHGHELDDRLAAHIQDWDRTASVEQFIGRDRSLRAIVVLLRGDPTISADEVIDFDEMDEAHAVLADADLGAGATEELA